METPSQPVFLREGDHLSSDATDRHQSLTDLLLEKGVLRPTSDGRLVIRFVGVAVAGAVTLVMLPKIALASPSDEVQRVTLRALRAYATWVPPFHEPSPHLNADPDRGEVSGVAMTDWLIGDFLSHGLYRRTITELQVNGTGRVDWRRTISRHQPIFSQGRPIYVASATRQSTADASNFATMLHLHIVETLSREFGALLDYEPISLDLEPVERIDILPSADECERRLGDEMRTAFSDRSMQLLNMLAAIVRAREVERGRELTLYGTGSFHHIWEAACGAVCGNEVQDWTGVLPAPVWRSANGEAQNAETFRPDIVAPLTDRTGPLLIADAKYYRASPPPRLSGIPGVNDVAKQVWYKRYLGDTAMLRGFSGIENVFLFPGTEGPLVQRWGTVDFPDGEQRIDVFTLDFLQALRAYADRSEKIVGEGRKGIMALIDPKGGQREND